MRRWNSSFENLRSTVRFDYAVAAAAQRGVGAFVEMSAHPSLVYALTDQLDEALIVGSGRRDEPILGQLSANIAAVAATDPSYRWADVTSGGDGPVQPMLPGFPNAPMRAIHLWAAAEPLFDERTGPALTVADEQWEPRAVRYPTVGLSTGVAIVTPEVAEGSGTEAASLASQLATALGRHQGCYLARSEEAEIVVMIAPVLLHPDVVVAAEQIGSRCGLDYQKSVGPRCRRVWLVTVRGECVQTGQPTGLPAPAALAAMHRSIGFEFPDCTFAHLDLPSSEISADEALTCIDVLCNDTESEVALRDGASGLCRYVRELRERIQLPPIRQPDAALLENVVITGGSGAIGLRYARYFLKLGVRRLILLSRSGIDPSAVGDMTGGREVEVHAPACDITNPEMVSAVAAEFAGDGASLFVHAAGSASFGLHGQLGESDLANMFGAKVIGLAQMVDSWPLRQEARILLCSSVSGLWGGHGQGGYAASNRMLDVLGSQLRAKGLHCTAVRWGLWQGTRVAGAEEIARVERSGLVAMEPDEAISAGLRHYEDDPLIFAADFDRLQLFFESQGGVSPFASVARPADGAGDNSDLGNRTVAEVVRAELAAALRLAGPASVDVNAALIDLGVDSLLALDLRKRLRRGTGCSVPLARLLGGITGAELVELLQQPSPAVTVLDKPKRLERLESTRD